MDCWQRVKVTYPADAAGQKKIVCNNVDQAIEVRLCQMGASLDPKMKELDEKRQKAMEKCMSKP